jgi:short-subunit dehydrogenase
VIRSEGKGRTALITGASAGIGEALAHVFAEHGWDLVLTARRRDRLENLAESLRGKYGIVAHVYPADLAEREACGTLTAALAKDGIAIDALVNNAGFAVPDSYRDTNWQAQRDFLEVLVAAPCELTHRLLPGMHARGFGRVLNVASVAGFMPGSASHTLYGGAKAMLITWSQALHSEEKGSGVHVTALCPGFTITEFHDVSGTRAAMNRLPRFMWLDSDAVAREGYRAVMENWPLCTPGLQYKTISALVRLLPRNFAHRIGELRSRVLDKRK